MSASKYANTPANIEVRRSTGLDDINRVYSQYQVDHGEYARPAVGPTNYQEGNIMPSQQITGPAGYNHRDPLVMPMRPADLNKAEYLVKEQNTMNPDMRAQMQMMTVLPQQKFLQTSRTLWDSKDGDPELWNARQLVHEAGCSAEEQWQVTILRFV